MEIKVKTIKCPNCGGTLQFDPALQITICNYCGNTLIIEKKDIGESKLQVDMIVPFKITKENFVSLVHNWMGKGFFTRKDVSVEATIDEVVGIYIPFFAYDIKWAGWIEADIGYDKWVEYYDYSSKQQKTKTETEWRPFQMQGELSFQMVGLASKAIKTEYAEFCENSSLASLKEAREFQGEYLLGFISEPFSIDYQQIFEERVNNKALEEVAAYAHRKASQRGNRYKNVSYSTHLEYKAQSVYFPYWLATYKYREKTYEIIVDGSAGRITGSKPLSPAKIITTLLLVIGVPLLLLMGILKGPLREKIFFARDNVKDVALKKSTIAPNESAKRAVITAIRANIRDGPGTSHSILTTLSKGEEIRVIGSRGEWLTIEYDPGGVGWIHKSLIQYVDP